MKSRKVFSWEPGKTSNPSGYSFWAAIIEAMPSKSALICVVMIRMQRSLWQLRALSEAAT